jgi:hypothetical protein
MLNNIGQCTPNSSSRLDSINDFRIPPGSGFSKPSYDEPEGGEPILGHWDITSLVEALVVTNGALVKGRLLLLTLLDNRFVRGSI